MWMDTQLRFFSLLFWSIIIFCIDVLWMNLIKMRFDGFYTPSLTLSTDKLLSSMHSLLYSLPPDFKRFIVFLLWTLLDPTTDSELRLLRLVKFSLFSYKKGSVISLKAKDLVLIAVFIWFWYIYKWVISACFSVISYLDEAFVNFNFVFIFSFIPSLLLITW